MKNWVLLVDDNPSNLIVFEEILSDLDVECIKAKSANEAFSVLKEHDISIILLDVQMPDIDGFETLKRIRENKDWENIPVIMISAVYKTDKFQIKGIKLGALDFIVKPIIPDLLKAKIRTFLELYNYRKIQDIKLKDLSSKVIMTEIIRNENLILVAANIIFQNINKYRSQEETADYIIDVLLKVTDSKFGFLSEINKSGELELTTTLTPFPFIDKKIEQVYSQLLVDINTRKIWRTAIHKKQSIVNNTIDELEYIGNHIIYSNILCVPLLRDNEVYGLIGLANKSKEYDEKDIENIEILSSIVTEATSRKKVELELEKYKISLEKMVDKRTKQLEINNQKLQLEEKERKAAFDVINTSPAIAFRWKRIDNPTLEYVSENVEELSGYTVEELVSGKVRITDIVYPEDLPRVKKELISFIKDGTKNNYSHKPYRIFLKNGEMIWVDQRFFFNRNKDGYVTYFKGIILNITDKIQAEEELIIAKEKAEESDRLKSSFLANMSHEIRTPMNAILGFSQLLMLPGIDNEEINEYIETINNSAKELLKLIDDIISISQIEAGIIELHLENINLEKIMVNAYKLFKHHAENKGINFSYKNMIPVNDVSVSTDPRRVHQIILNLISNAFKFTTKGSIEFGCTPQNDYIEFYIRDTGIGIKQGEELLIFDNFMQSDHGRDILYGGTGIGLSITKAIVEKLGGKIWVVTTYNDGAEFRFTIPAKKQASINKKIDDVDKKKFPDYSNKTILIAEDEYYNFRLLKILLTRTKANVLWAKDGHEVLKTMKNNSDIDLVLMDIKMPGMDGTETTKEIRKTNNTIPIIALTAYVQAGDKEKTIIAGCNNYLAKPIQKNDLFEVISKYI